MAAQVTTAPRRLHHAPGVLQRRRARSLVMSGLFWTATIAAVIPLVAVLLWVFLQGLPALNVAFFTKLPGPPDDPNQGVANAIVGTLELLGIAGLIAVPIGVGAGIYIAEFGGSRYNTILRFATDVLSGVPSITIGVFVYALVVLPMQQFSALALGAPTWRTILRYALPAALPGIITGGLLAMARAAGETAPLLFTALGNNQWNRGLTEPIDALTLKVYFYAGQAYDVWRQISWAGAVVLTLLVLITSVLARLATRSRHAR
jgi:phosphate transport system permease protein